MIVHIVMFKFKEADRDANVLKTKTMLEALVGKIEPLISMEVGINFKQSDRALDLVLTSTFATRDDLAVYADHPAHLEVLAFIQAVTESSKVVDYER